MTNLAGTTVGLLSALGAIVLWASLAALITRLSTLPPLLLTGLALLLGAVVSLPRWRDWRVPRQTFLIGTGALFFYHLFLFLALRLAPPVLANLVNYLWPLFIVLLSPLFDRTLAVTARLLLAGLIGFAGAASAIVSSDASLHGTLAWLGLLLALLAALLWAGYSQLLRRLPAFSSWAVGGFGAAAGVLALLAHVLLEPATTIAPTDIGWLLLLGFGPMGLAFVLWDRAMKTADPRRVGVLAYLTPVLSTLALLQVTGGHLTLALALATALVVLAAVLAMPARRTPEDLSSP